MPSDLLDAPVPVADVVLAYKPGIPGDQVAAAGALIASAEGLDALGVHMHFPRHVADPGPLAVALRAYAALIEELSAAAGGWRPREIDVGGGFPLPRDPAGRALDRRAGRAARAADRGVRRRRRRRAGRGVPPAPCSRSSPVARCSATRACTSRACSASSGRPRPSRTRGSRPTRARRSCPTGCSSTTAGPCSPPGGLDEPAALRGDVVGRSCGFDVLAANADLPAVERPATCSRSSIPAPTRTPRRATSTRCRARRPCSSAATATRSSSGARRRPTCSRATSAARAPARPLRA